MIGTFIIVLLIASIAALSIGFLLVAARLGKNFEQISDQSSRGQASHRRTHPRR